ncbi:leucine-rich repeat-containing protein 24 [Hyposmocoma kahamanoa]|uniref:leucine-rich repeat-containing protein 24 n=1 Tax=Hyposmocoma kahamanoa TaxID=1477025 RepID=UPI000E6D9B2F|nr:leucine-rich repeat-containing protein 24 [Hyposmocoma kahamanoa]
MELRIYLVLLIIGVNGSRDLCPKECDCDIENGLNRATCVNQHIVNVDVGVPTAVQVYSLSNNAISELDNYCFKEIGYTSIQILNLSYNLIFWIGLHAFAGLHHLIHLDLHNNRLRHISSETFWDTPELEVLDLSSNVFESLRNEPFLMHTKLEVLNLQNCRIKALPERMFNRLPNLKKLDLSHNYMVTLNTEVLQPLPKLERVELKNEYWKCDPPFIAAESWIVSHGIMYEKICKNRTPKMFEKIISAVTPEKEEIDVNNVWNITKDKNDSVVPISKPTTPLTPFQKFDKEFSSFKALILGMEIGLGLGIVGTYIWLRSLCKCGHCTRPKSRRERRRERRADAEVRNSLLWTTVIHPDLETPPVFRRQPSLPDENPPYPTYGLPSVVEAGLQIDAICLPDRAETPPPAYSECRMLYGS